MSELSTEQKKQVSAKLADRRAELIGEIKGELERSSHQHFQDLAGEVADAGDASVADMLVDFDIAMVKRQVEELTQVERAQKRCDSDGFNTCEQCGEDIGFPRLMASPIAIRCIKCQEQHEKFYGHEETPRL